MKLAHVRLTSLILWTRGCVLWKLEAKSRTSSLTFGTGANKSRPRVLSVSAKLPSSNPVSTSYMASSSVSPFDSMTFPSLFTLNALSHSEWLSQCSPNCCLTVFSSSLRYALALRNHNTCPYLCPCICLQGFLCPCHCTIRVCCPSSPSYLLSFLRHLFCHSPIHQLLLHEATSLIRSVLSCLIHGQLSILSTRSHHTSSYDMSLLVSESPCVIFASCVPTFPRSMGTGPSSDILKLGLSLSSLHQDLGIPMKTEIQSDSSTENSFTDRLGAGQRTKHIDTRYFWIQERVQDGDLSIKKVPTSKKLRRC